MKRKRNKDKLPTETAPRLRVPKLCGADVELGNFILGLDLPGGTAFEASRALLAQIDGLPLAHWYEAPGYASLGLARESYLPFNGRYSWPQLDGHAPLTDVRAGCLEPGPGDGLAQPDGFDPQDWGRKFLASNGGCVYIDLNHLEVCLPEVCSAYDHVACWHAMLRIARKARDAADLRMPRGTKLQVLVNNSDGNGNSYGSHLSFLVTREAWDNLFHRKIHQMLYLAAFQASSIVYTGQGKVGSENGSRSVAFQISQRADFFETLSGSQTTFRRPIVNSRDEPLCGRAGRGSLKHGGPSSDLPDAGSPEEPAHRWARLHVIFFDSTLCHVASLLKVGVMQIILSMIEEERVDPGLILEDPVKAVVRWSHDPLLEARAALVDGREVTAVELQLLFLEQAKSFVASGGCDQTVPRAREILALWEDTLAKLHARDFEALAPRLDWVLKLQVLERAMRRQPQLRWDSPEVKHLDHLYSSLDRAEGLYWALETSGFVEKVVTEEEIQWFTANPPGDTRAWTRAMLLRRAGPELAHRVDWDRVQLKSGRGPAPAYRTVELADPLGFTRGEMEPVFSGARSLDDLLDGLGATTERPAFPGEGGDRSSLMEPHCGKETA